jgi:hypothetical protein
MQRKRSLKAVVDGLCPCEDNCQRDLSNVGSKLCAVCQSEGNNTPIATACWAKNKKCNKHNAVSGQVAGEIDVAEEIEAESIPIKSDGESTLDAVRLVRNHARTVTKRNRTTKKLSKKEAAFQQKEDEKKKAEAEAIDSVRVAAEKEMKRKVDAAELDKRQRFDAAEKKRNDLAAMNDAKKNVNKDKKTLISMGKRQEERPKSDPSSDTESDSSSSSSTSSSSSDSSAASARASGPNQRPLLSEPPFSFLSRPPQPPPPTSAAAPRTTTKEPPPSSASSSRAPPAVLPPQAARGSSDLIIGRKRATTFAEKAGKVVVDNSGGGDCFFQAIARSLLGQSKTLEEVEASAIVLRDWYCKFLDDNHGQLLVAIDNGCFESRDIESGWQGKQGAYPSSIAPIGE